MSRTVMIMAGVAALCLSGCKMSGLDFSEFFGFGSETGAVAGGALGSGSGANPTSGQDTGTGLTSSAADSLGSSSGQGGEGGNDSTEPGFTTLPSGGHAIVSNPEPASLALFGGGLVGLGFLRHRLRKPSA